MARDTYLQAILDKTSDSASTPLTVQMQADLVGTIEQVAKENGFYKGKKSHMTELHLKGVMDFFYASLTNKSFDDYSETRQNYPEIIANAPRTAEQFIVRMEKAVTMAQELFGPEIHRENHAGKSGDDTDALFLKVVEETADKMIEKAEALIVAPPARTK